MEILVIMLATFLAGVVQTVSGFGGSLVIMLFLPAIMPPMDAIMVKQTAMILLNISLIFTYRKSIRFRQVLLPAAVCLLFTTVFIDISLMVNVQTMKLLFGLFLIGTSIYFWFFSQKVRCKASPAMACFSGTPVRHHQCPVWHRRFSHCRLLFGGVRQYRCLYWDNPVFVPHYHTLHGTRSFSAFPKGWFVKPSGNMLWRELPLS